MVEEKPTAKIEWVLSEKTIKYNEEHQKGWYYHKEMQGLLKPRHTPTHDDQGNLLPHLQALKEPIEGMNP